MKKLIALLLGLCIFAGCVMLGGCQSPVDKVTEMIDKLSQEEITLDLSDEIQAIKKLLAKLSEADLEKLVDMEKFEAIVEKYNALEEKAAQELEDMIEKLPPADEIKESSKEAIQAALDAYEKASDAVKEKVENSGILEEARKQLEKLQSGN